MFSANQTTSAHQKDTVINAEATGKFCWNLATWDLREELNIKSEQVPYDVDEYARARLESLDSKIVRVSVGKEDRSVPMVAWSPARFECEHYTTLRLPGNPPTGAVDVVIGKVVGIHIDESVLTDGKIDVAKTQPIARCGYYEYAVVRKVFEMRMPNTSEEGLAGLEESVRGSRAMGEKAREKGEGDI